MQSVTLSIRVVGGDHRFTARKPQAQLAAIPKYGQSVSIQVAGLPESNRSKVEGVIYREGGEVLIELAEMNASRAIDGITIEHLCQNFGAAHWEVPGGLEKLWAGGAGII